MGAPRPDAGDRPKLRVRVVLVTLGAAATVAAGGARFLPTSEPVIVPRYPTVSPPAPIQSEGPCVVITDEAPIGSACGEPPEGGTDPQW